jgi:beta-lactamase class D
MEAEQEKYAFGLQLSTPKVERKHKANNLKEKELKNMKLK